MGRIIGVALMTLLGVYLVATGLYPRHPLTRGSYYYIRVTDIVRFGAVICGALLVAGAVFFAFAR